MFQGRKGLGGSVSKGLKIKGKRREKRVTTCRGRREERDHK